MQLQDFLVEKKYPETDYGYWISPDSRVIVVGYQRHSAVMRNELHLEEKQAFIDGWVRVIAYSDWFGIEYVEHKLNSRSLKTIKELSGAKPYHNYSFRPYDVETSNFIQKLIPLKEESFIRRLDFVYGLEQSVS